jgi:hypothetical protein
MTTAEVFGPDEAPSRRCGRCGLPTVIRFERHEHEAELTASVGPHDVLQVPMASVPGGSTGKFGCMTCGNRFELLSDDRLALFGVVGAVMFAICVLAAVIDAAPMFLFAACYLLGLVIRVSVHLVRAKANPPLRSWASS